MLGDDLEEIGSIGFGGEGLLAFGFMNGLGFANLRLIMLLLGRWGLVLIAFLSHRRLLLK